MCKPVVHTLDGNKVIMAFQMAGVAKALGAVSRIVGAGNDVVFSHPDRGGSYIINNFTKHKTPLRQQYGVYYLDVWSKHGECINADVFHRQVS